MPPPPPLRCTDDLLAAVVCAATGATAPVADVVFDPLDHRVENLTTARLDRARVRLADGSTVTAVAKTLRPASASPAFAVIPPEHHQQVLEDLHWLDEPDVYRSGLGDVLPAPLRMPAVYAIDSTDDELVTLWMEDVADVEPWSLERYGRTASALGALAGRWTGHDAATAFGLHGRPIERLFFGKVSHVDLPAHAHEAFWADPAVRATVDERHRADLDRLAGVVPRLLGELATLPAGVCHGDAAPDNFHEPGDATVVALDWSYGHVGAVGTDLAQLFAGRFESGAADVTEIPDIADTILAGFVDGLRSQGSTVDTDAVRLAWATHLAVRSVFSALVVEHRDDVGDEERTELVRRRAAMARFGIDLALDVAGA